MNYGCCAIRLDLGKEIRIRTVQFYDIPGTRSSPEIVSLISYCVTPHSFLLLPDVNHFMAP